MSLAEKISQIKEQVDDLLSLQQAALDKLTASKRRQVIDQITELVDSLSDKSEKDVALLRKKIELLNKRGTLISVKDGAILWNALTGQIDATLVQEVSEMGGKIYSPYFTEDGGLFFYFTLF